MTWPAAAAAIICRTSPSPTPRPSSLPTRLTFRCFSQELGTVIAGFACSPYSLVVKAVNVEGLAAGALATDAAASVVAATPVPSPTYVPSPTADADAQREAVNRARQPTTAAMARIESGVRAPSRPGPIEPLSAPAPVPQPNPSAAPRRPAQPRLPSKPAPPSRSTRSS